MPCSSGGYEKALFLQSSLQISVCISLSEPWGDFRYRSGKVLSIVISLGYIDRVVLSSNLGDFLSISSSPSNSKNFKGTYNILLLILLYIVACLFVDGDKYMPRSAWRGQWIAYRSGSPFHHVSSGTELKLSGLTDIFTHGDI